MKEGENVEAVEQEQEPKIRVETEERHLQCVLTLEEFDAKAAELTRAIDECAGAEANKKVVAAEMKSKIEEATARVSKLNRIVGSRTEMRDVECAVEFDYDAYLVTITRKDTGAEVDKREMKLAERQRQRDLFPDPEEPEGGAENTEDGEATE